MSAPLLPPVSDLRQVAIAVAIAVARQAQADGVAEPMDAAATGAVNGGFFGPVAQEVGATWRLSDGKAQAVGVIAGTKQ